MFSPPLFLRPIGATVLGSILLGSVLPGAVATLPPASPNEIVLDIPSTPEHPRNSEGAFVTLQSGRILLIYSQFSGGDRDGSSARLAEVHSDDGGGTWSVPAVLRDKENNLNVMSVSLLRLASGKIALFYLVKKTNLECRPSMAVSTDEGKSWSQPHPLFDAPGYYVLNNDRIIQTRQGRLIAPVAFHRAVHADPADQRSVSDRGIALLWYYSDDEGGTWSEAASVWGMTLASRNGLQEPGLVELTDGSLLSWARTDQGAQYALRSVDAGNHWTPPEGTELVSPLSPASIKRLPGSAELLAVYNDHSGRFPFRATENPYHGREPLVAAISHDSGYTWPQRKLLEGDTDGAFAYIAIHFTEAGVLLAYSAGQEKGAHLGTLRVRRLARSWLIGSP